MYESHFQFHSRPFTAAPQPLRYVPIAAMELARQTLIRCVERAEGPGLVVGPAGSGKSLLCQLVADFSRRQHFQVAVLASARISTRRALLQNILFELHLPYRGMEEGELRLSLVDHLEPRGGGLAGLLLVVDEAHTLPLKLLEEIRLISNFIRDGQPRVRLILAGSAQLEERLANPKLESLQQRIAARCYLQPMNREDTAFYIRQQIQNVGGNDALFTSDALKAVYTATDGVPRLVNQVCDHALILSALGGHSQIGPEAIEEAWSDLQQLPAPWHQTSRKESAAPAAVVEFGQLQDDEGIAEEVVEIEREASGWATSATTTQRDEIQPSYDYRETQAELRIGENLNCLNSGLGALDSAEGIEFGTFGDLYEDAVEFEPVGDAGTQVELTFSTPANPFGDGFDEEEIVVDHYANLAANYVSDMLDHQDGTREIAEQIVELARQTSTAAQSAAILPEADFSEPLRVHVESQGENVHESDAFDPASDPVLPEETSVARRNEPRRPLGGTARPKRREYRTLFSTLRNR
ncbi:MAG: ExeA family protein [Pirellulaceae bacterium]